MAEEKHNYQNKNGFIEWKINRNLMHQFKNANDRQMFHSPQFKTIDGTIWRIRFYPYNKAYISSGECTLCVECVKLSAKKRRIGVNFSFNIMELDWCADYADTFDKDGCARGCVKSLKPEQLNNLGVMTVKCSVEETMDVRDENSYFEWKVLNYGFDKNEARLVSNIYSEKEMKLRQENSET
eukprot:379517_1